MELKDIFTMHRFAKYEGDERLAQVLRVLFAHQPRSLVLTHLLGRAVERKLVNERVEYTYGDLVKIFEPVDSDKAFSIRITRPVYEASDLHSVRDDIKTFVKNKSKGGKLYAYSNNSRIGLGKPSTGIHFIYVQWREDMHKYMFIDVEHRFTSGKTDIRTMIDFDRAYSRVILGDDVKVTPLVGEAISQFLFEEFLITSPVGEE